LPLLICVPTCSGRIWLAAPSDSILSTKESLELSYNTHDTLFVSHLIFVVLKVSMFKTCSASFRLK